MLTVGGFTQPSVARALIEQPSNSEKGLSSCFLRLFPNVIYGNFDDLGQVDPDFISKISMSLKDKYIQATMSICVWLLHVYLYVYECGPYVCS